MTGDRFEIRRERLVDASSPHEFEPSGLQTVTFVVHAVPDGEAKAWDAKLQELVRRALAGDA